MQNCPPLGDARTVRRFVGPCSQRRPYHRKATLRPGGQKLQRMAGKSSLWGERKMHPPQASGKRPEFDPCKVKLAYDIKYLIRGGGRSPAEPVCEGLISDN